MHQDSWENEKWNYSREYTQFLDLKNLEASKDAVWSYDNAHVRILWPLIWLYLLYNWVDKINNNELSSKDIFDMILIPFWIFLSGVWIYSWKEVWKYRKSEVQRMIQEILEKKEVWSIDNEKENLLNTLSNDEKAALIDKKIAKL